MRVLLDECVPQRLRRELAQQTVSTVPEEGWASLRNGELLRLMSEARFDVFVTVDRSLMHQQKVAATSVAVIVLHARSNRLQDLQKLGPALRLALQNARPGRVTRIGS